MGSYCTGGTAKTPCTAGDANPFLGATEDAAYCAACGQSATTPWTSTPGAEYCTVPWYNVKCTGKRAAAATALVGSRGGPPALPHCARMLKVAAAVPSCPAAAAGQEFDASVNACVDCRAGTFRAALDSNLECQECPPGTYSAAGAGTCSDCPAGQYNPSSGLADQEVASNGIHCLVCPLGSLALISGPASTSSTPPPKATTCEPCPAGTYARADLTVACAACAGATYRSGDAAPENNECKKVPAGYKANADTAATDIAPCRKGSVSYYNGATRVPASSPTTCQACGTAPEAVKTYAPRDGMAACLPCKGGSFATDSGIAADGNDQCTDCAAGTYRSFYTVSATCATCNAGYEAGPSSHQACTQCRPGTYKDTDGTTDYCSECPTNTYQATPGAKTDCVSCPKGYETQDTGNTECSPCAVGYYKPTNARVACTVAPVGTFVNSSAAFFYTPCAVGTFNSKTAQDSCDPCPPGQYANTLGSKSCKTCPAGTFSSGQSATCKACSAGYYAPAGSAACSPCKPGYYTSAARAGTCSLCPKGSQCPSPATSTPKACSLGYYAAKDGQKLCTPCPVNY